MKVQRGLVKAYVTCPNLTYLSFQNRPLPQKELFRGNYPDDFFRVENGFKCRKEVFIFLCLPDPHNQRGGLKHLAYCTVYNIIMSSI